MNRDCFWLTKDQFARLKPLLPSDTRGKPRVDDRRVISGIVHVLKSGGRWIDAPDVYGPHQTLYNRFVRWPRRASGSTSSIFWHRPEARPLARVDIVRSQQSWISCRFICW